MVFGEGPLRLPLLVEAAETLFHPVVIRNNVDGYEGEVRERFKEPSWNNPVMRFLDGKAQDVLPRKDRVWAMGDVLARLVDVLDKDGDAPVWLETVAAETASGEVETAVFAMS